ncbi:DUF4270 family protein [Dysgonomonas macrotermitis]|uniref:DUF4270 domain-containing protein n=1 Tax=Dysgonomonas macrotermitis TaxID=1346286 RepID=A0A1M4WAS5_9BACT|nr:DUF4270 family protein [Dysgonomonas macrotermitis]SHE78319.1 protein of unknown function [Dysgonomonas macrotermitis]
MRYIICSIVCFLSIVSCINDKFSVGDNLTSVTGRSLIIDTCTVELHTQLADSSVTSGLSKVFEGKYNTGDLGTITTHAYFDFNQPSYSTSEFGSNATVAVKFDSISLILKYDDFRYGDTTQVQTLNIYKLKQIIELDDDDKLYSTNSVPSESEPWVSYKFNRPTKFYENDSTLEIRLPDEFGLELMRMMHAQSDSLDTYENFQKYFKGIKLSPGANDNATVNSFVIDDSYPVIRLYYRTISSSSTEKYMDLNVGTSTAFSQIEVDRSNTVLSPINYKNNSLNSKDCENKAYIQGIIGLSAKINFPYINEMLKMSKYVVISQAYLYAYPVLGSYNDFTPLPQELSLNYFDENGKAMDIYVDQTTSAVQSGTLVEDKVYNKNTYYAFDITSYLKQEIEAIGMNKTSLQLQLSDEDTSGTLKSLVIGDPKYSNENNRIRLVIYFITYDND